MVQIVFQSCYYKTKQCLIEIRAVSAVWHFIKDGWPLKQYVWCLKQNMSAFDRFN